MGPQAGRGARRRAFLAPGGRGRAGLPVSCHPPPENRHARARPCCQVILYCQIGGSLQPWASSEDGRQSRSLIAAYELLRAGYRSVAVVEGGYAEWEKQGRESDADE